MPSIRDLAQGSQPVLGRRRFVEGLAAAGVLAGLGARSRTASAQQASAGLPVLTGDRFHLTARRQPVNITGNPSWGYIVNGSLPALVLRWREGDTVTIRLDNGLPEMTAIHWHGIITPTRMDGVPGLSFPGVEPGGSFTYRFPVRQSGTYWYHSHAYFQEQKGVYGALVIEPRGGERIRADRDYVVMLSDWTDDPGELVLSNLKQQSDYYNYHRRTASTFFEDVAKRGLGATVAERWRWGDMHMSPTDVADVTGANYTFLMNGMPPAANWIGLFRPGETVRLRFINASAMTNYDVRIPGLPLTVVQAHGNDVEPVTVEQFRIGVAETYDLVVRPRDDAYTIFAQAQDRSGNARGTLAVRPGLGAAVPPLDPRPMRTMTDMGMGMMQPDQPAMSDRNNSRLLPRQVPGRTPEPQASGIGAMMHGGMGNGMSGMGGHGVAMDGSPMPVPNRPAQGPAVATVARMPTERLNRPGGGVDEIGRRALTYADLRALKPGDDPRDPGQTHEPTNP